ncbi:MAG TPA: ATP-binding protein [Roseiflexaceae bacterium]|nr:ATP-binding protein [Roseiflexaceae bacterium]
MLTLTADQLIQYLSWAVFVAIFGHVIWQLARFPRRANLNIALLFSATTLVIVSSSLARLGVLPRELNGAISGSAILSLPYLLLRLLDDIVVVPTALRRTVGALLAGSVLTIWATPTQRPAWLNMLMLLYIVVVIGYTVVVSLRATLRSRGITRRRMAAVTAGSLFLVLNIAVGNGGLWMPQLAPLWRILADLFGLFSAAGYYLGFAPPGWLRRAWQEPELRAFLARATTLTRLPDTWATARALERGAADSLGAPYASIGLWDSAAQQLRFKNHGQSWAFGLDVEIPATKAFRAKEAMFFTNTRYDHPDLAELERSGAASTVLVAPIIAGEKRLGVLMVYAPRAPLFADDDLALVQLLADQAAVLLENRALIDEAAATRARAEASRFKEDFLSAAAHDLKTPLTTLIALAQLLERRASRDPHAPVDQAALQRLVQEGQRLRALVLELLDAAHVEQGSLLSQRETVDLAAMVRTVCARQSSPRHTCIVEASEAVVGLYDAQRITQLVENLIENAIKYSPQGGPVRVSVRQDERGIHLTVSDCGIGIPSEDLPLLFSRFHRGTNVDDRRFPGMGLGLFICKGIVEQHGGQIVVNSRLGEGSTFEVTLPLAPARAAMYAA